MQLKTANAMTLLEPSGEPQSTHRFREFSGKMFLDLSFPSGIGQHGAILQNLSVKMFPKYCPDCRGPSNLKLCLRYFQNGTDCYSQD